MGKFDAFMEIVKSTQGLEYDLLESIKYGHVYEIISALDFSKYDALFSFGGDGTSF
jgi:diacylglycerol kinase family enzyme